MLISQVDNIFLNPEIGGPNGNRDDPWVCYDVDKLKLEAWDLSGGGLRPSQWGLGGLPPLF